MNTPIVSFLSLARCSSVCLGLVVWFTVTATELVSADEHKLQVDSSKSVLDSAALIKSGTVYSLAITTGPDTPALLGRSYSVEIVPLVGEDGQGVGANRLTGYDDRVTVSNGIGTQIDGLAHVGIDHIYYGGHTADEIFTASGVKIYSVDQMAPIVTRGVLVDVAGLKSVPSLPGGYEITLDDILDSLARQDVVIKKGDVVLIHTGWLAQAGPDAERFNDSSPGIGAEAAAYLVELGVIAVGADTWGVEVVPSADPREVFPVHQQLITKAGIYLLENVWTQELANDGAYDFFFVLAAPRLAGTVQAIVHPLAIK